jgi:hypothetical protein
MWEHAKKKWIFKLKNLTICLKNAYNSLRLIMQTRNQSRSSYLKGRLCQTIKDVTARHTKIINLFWDKPSRSVNSCLGFPHRRCRLSSPIMKISLSIASSSQMEDSFLQAKWNGTKLWWQKSTHKYLNKKIREHREQKKFKNILKREANKLFNSLIKIIIYWLKICQQKRVQEKSTVGLKELLKKNLDFKWINVSKLKLASISKLKHF